MPANRLMNEPTKLQRSTPWFTIERLRTLVIIGGVLLIAAIALFLAAGQWKRRFLSKDLPGRLGIDISQQADGVNYTQTRKGKTLFKIHAARAVQMKKDGKTLLHDVKIDLYGEDGNRADTISGSEFEYDPTAGIAHAIGAVEIELMRPGVAPAIAQLKPGAQKSPALPNQVAGEITDNDIHVKTSGLTFDQKSQVATTDQRVDFALRQGNGSSIGATFESGKGHLVLNTAVELHIDQAANRTGGPVTIHASHGEFTRGQQICELTRALADYSGGNAQFGNALIHFRDDGSVIKLDGSGGVDIQTKAGSHVTAPVGTMDFDEKNHPRHGLLQGGTTLEMTEAMRHVLGSSPTAQLDFDGEGQLKHAYLERGVVFNSQQQVTTPKGAAAQLHRTWKSQTADILFAVAAPANAGKKSSQAKGQAPSQAQSDISSKVEPRTIHGTGGVVITSETTIAGITVSGGAGTGAGAGAAANSGTGVAGPSRLSADSVVAQLEPGSVLSSLSGTGHASFEQRTAQGVHQASSSDQLDVRFETGAGHANGHASAKNGVQASGVQASGAQANAVHESAEIASITQVGHVLLMQDATPGHGGSAGQSPVRATAARADYDGSSELLHLSGSPRVQNGALDMTANRIDFARASGDAFAHGDVKASWSGSEGKSASAPNLGGNGPAHAIAAEAELHQSTQEVTFRGSSGVPARLWQASNSVSAPTILLNRQKQTLTATASGQANPVHTVLLSNSKPRSGSEKTSAKAKPDGPSIIQVRSGELHYSEGERVALFSSGSVGSVTTDTSGASGAATVVSDEAEVKLLPPGVHPAVQAGPGTVQTGSGTAGNPSIDRMTARGHVNVIWPGRRGIGDKLVYLSDDETFTLTGTGAAPPRITDQVHGNVTGSALIFHTRDDSVTVEGDGGKTVTETQAPKKRS
ncbi:hypothetical protein [Acidicapsa ligni]|uniref:hypothetical protein n=1 Tax=Acidicapsa ligni TaxID=542300 RepID=UPI0021E0EB68|nr:hypothetical protein [Acidicapsa ligni]